MEYLNNFTDVHYQSYLPKTHELIGNCRDVDCWLKLLKKDELFYWIKTTKVLLNDIPDYEYETSIILSTLITLFIYELDVENQEIKLTNKELKKIVKRFNKALHMEYAFRNDLQLRGKKIHSLLKD